jgi:hypothetical protein
VYNKIYQRLPSSGYDTFSNAAFCFPFEGPLFDLNFERDCAKEEGVIASERLAPEYLCAFNNFAISKILFPMQIKLIHF